MGIKIGTFVLHRVEGTEIYRIEKATISASESENGVELFLYANTDKNPIQTLPDTAEFPTQPNAEVSVSLDQVKIADLVTNGVECSVPSAWSEEKQDHVACLYFYSHQDLNQNVVRFEKQRGETFLVHWTAQTGDPNAYDGSQPETQVEIKAWFEFKEFARWSHR